ncbi:hypothetical protein ACQI5H_04915 [Mycobacterium heidelbergense]
MTTAEQPPPEGDKQPPQAADVDSPADGNDGTDDADPEDESS